MAIAAMLLGAGPPPAAAAPPPAPGPATGSDGALVAAVRTAIRGQVLATARADLPGGSSALLVASSGDAGLPRSFLLAILAPDAAGGFALEARDELDGSATTATATVALAAGQHPVTPGALTATVGWRAADGSAEERVILYRYGARKLTRLLALEPSRRHPEGSPWPSVTRALELLPTSTNGYRDLRVRALTVDCAAEDDCFESAEVTSHTFDGVRYVARPFPIPFVETITASSQLAERGGLVDRSPSAALDGRLDTAWCEGAKGAGWFEKLELSFQPAQRLQAVAIVPGAGTGEAFRERARPKRIRVLLPDGRRAEGELADEPRAQRIELPAGERVFGVTLVIVDVYKGLREDACIGELDLEVEP